VIVDPSERKQGHAIIHVCEYRSIFWNYGPENTRGEGKLR